MDIIKTTFKVNDDELMNVKRAGNAVNAIKMIKEGNNLSKYRRISDTEYNIVNEHGEIVGTGVYKSSATYKSMRNVMANLKKLRLIIMGNFHGEDNERLITLTYNTFNNNYDKVVKDFKNFINRLNYKYKSYKLEWIRILEVCDSGCFHFHVLMKNVDSNNLGISKSTLRNIWGHGDADLQKLYDIKGLALYFTTLTSKKSNLHKKLNDITSTKAERIKYYPKKAKIYTKSKGIKGVTSEGKKKYVEIVKSAKENSGTINQYLIMDGDTVVNAITSVDIIEKKES